MSPLLPKERQRYSCIALACKNERVECPFDLWLTIRRNEGNWIAPQEGLGSLQISICQPRFAGEEAIKTSSSASTNVSKAQAGSNILSRSLFASAFAIAHGCLSCSRRSDAISSRTKGRQSLRGSWAVCWQCLQLFGLFHASICSANPKVEQVWRRAWDLVNERERIVKSEPAREVFEKLLPKKGRKTRKVALEAWKHGETWWLSQPWHFESIERITSTGREKRIYFFLVFFGVKLSWRWIKEDGNTACRLSCWWRMGRGVIWLWCMLWKAILRVAYF